MMLPAEHILECRRLMTRAEDGFSAWIDAGMSKGPEE